jgi:predicted nucleotidyltransferase
MKSEVSNTASEPASPWYRGAGIPRKLIRRFASDVAARFRPDKIILFGSYAYGRPHADSDVDILVIMPTRNELDQAARICLEVDHNFPVDLLVRTPRNLAWRLAEGDSFLKEVMERGRVLYEKADGRVGPQGGARLPRESWPEAARPKMTLFASVASKRQRNSSKPCLSS